MSSPLEAAASALVLSNPTPADGSVVSDSTRQIKVRFEDDPAIKVLQTDVVLKVDGKIVYHTITYDTTVEYDSCGVPMKTYNYNRGWINGPVMKSGTHDVSVTVTDIVGNTATLDWQYSMDTFEITTVPVNDSRVGSLNPQITVKATNLYADESDVLTATIKVNGADRPVSIERIDTQNWTVTTNVYNLKNDVAVSVTGNLSNNRGVSKNYSFKFTPSISPPHLFVLHALPGSTITNLVDNERLIRIEWSDADGIDPTSLDMTVDQQPVTAKVEGPVIVGPELMNGTHTISVRIKDKLGNEASKTYTVTFKVPPKLSNPQKSYNSLQPLLTFPLIVMGSGLDPAKTSLTVDGKQYPVTISGGKVTCQMPQMDNETEHTATLIAVDNEGLSSTFNLRFGVNTFGEMPYNNNGCTGCHDSRYYKTQNKWAHTLAPDAEAEALEAGNPDAINCYHCHGITWNETVLQNYCYYCHDVVDTSDPHKTTPNATTPIPPVPALSRPGTNCVNCHAPLSRIPGDWWPGAFTMPLGFDYPYDPAEKTDYPYKHLIYSSHNTVYDTVYGNCQQCHGSNLTRTHNNKKSKTTGKLIDCGTCHLSTDTKVKEAIVNKKTECTACHNTQQGHDSLHTGATDERCTPCHKDTLTQDHLTRTDSSGSKYTCSTCHFSSDEKVLRTIAADNKNCAGCHTEAHNLQLIDKVPVDIPLYNGVEWTRPVEASIFKGDKGIPVGYQTGQVLISSRSTTIGSSDVWSFYNTGLTEGKWQLKSGAPTNDVTHFAAEFVKGSRYLIVKFYKTISHDGTGELSPDGGRIELWYK